MVNLDKGRRIKMTDEFSDFLKREKRKGFYRVILWTTTSLFILIGFIIMVFVLLNSGIKHFMGL